ncbi:MAG: hypothetical protein EP297_07920 [Gammaproteobacteria bacterium]|nr:MAG: hypothetical protein EP297_07920 [Gammaproteobacteria bacterium]
MVTMTGMRTILLIFTLLFIASCETTTAYKNWSALYAIPVGSKVILNEDLSIRPRHTQAFIQDGKQAYQRSFFKGYDQYYPFCYFEVHDVVDREQTIDPDTFNITRVSREQTDIVQVDPAQYRGLSAGDDDGGPPYIVDLNIMWLESASQPNVKKLACASGFDDPFDARLPTIEEIQHALGQVASLVLAK